MTSDSSAFRVAFAEAHRRVRLDEDNEAAQDEDVLRARQDALPLHPFTSVPTVLSSLAGSVACKTGCVVAEKAGRAIVLIVPEKALLHLQVG